jgi:hypothetical protein
MRREVRFALLGLVIVGLLGFLWWQDGRRDAAEARQATLAEGTRAMKALNQADATFPDQVRERLAAVGVLALTQPAQAGDTLEREVVPMFDRYLVTIDVAVAAAERVLAQRPDRDVARSVELIRARAATTRTMRDGLAALRGRIAAGATGEDIARELQAIAMTALRQGLAPPSP